MGKAERALANHPGVSSPAPAPATWSVTACLTYRGGLEIRATAQNFLPGWGHGGERFSFFLRLRRRIRLVVTSQCGRAPAPAETDRKPRGVKLLRFLRNRLARAAPLVPSVLRRKKPPRSAAADKLCLHTPAIPSVLDRALMRPATTRALCVVAALAVAACAVAALRIMAGFMILPTTSCASWRCFLAKRFVRFLGPPLFEWLSKISFRFLDPTALCEWFVLPKLSLKWLFIK